MCPNCNVNSDRKRNLKRHMKRCHPGLKPFENPIKLGHSIEPKADCRVPTAEIPKFRQRKLETSEVSSRDALSRKGLCYLCPSQGRKKERVSQSESSVPVKKTLIDRSVQVGSGNKVCQNGQRNSDFSKEASGDLDDHQEEQAGRD
jgi:hypothetical protein